MNELIQILDSENCSLVVSSDEVHTFFGRGISDLFWLLGEKPVLLNGARIADKVVGKGAAALMVLGAVGEVYAQVISKPALALLEQAGIHVSYGMLVPNIVNREGSGMCPLEMRCMSCATAEECLTQIQAFIKEMSMKSCKG